MTIVKHNLQTLRNGKLKVILILFPMFNALTLILRGGKFNRKDADGGSIKSFGAKNGTSAIFI